MKLDTMKAKHLHVLTFGTLGLVVPAAADVIYSNLQSIGIPATFDGLYLNVETGAWDTNMLAPVAGWDINPFYGGRAFANSPDFQPVRSGTGSSSPVVNLAAGASVGTGSVFSSFVQGAGGETPNAPGYGFSQMLSGSGGNFTAGQEGYIGFKLNGADYGWMRVVFTNNTGGALIKDWAYDDNAGAITTGNVLQNGSTVTLNSASGSFTLGSQVTGTNSVVKDGANSATLTGTNNYSGTTTVDVGTLLVNGSITGTGTVSVADGATLGGTGSISGPVIVDGILAPGASIESLTTGALTLNTGSTFAYEMNSGAVPSVAADFQKVLGNLALNGTVNLTLADLASSPVAFAPNTKLSLINYTGTLNSGFFTYNSNELGEGETFTAGLNTWQIHYGATSGGLNFANEYSTGHFINLTAIPEPGSWLALGGLLASGAGLRRRRTGVSVAATRHGVSVNQ